jgi:hypothetical protein
MLKNQQIRTGNPIHLPECRRGLKWRIYLQFFLFEYFCFCKMLKNKKSQITQMVNQLWSNVASNHQYYKRKN